MAFRSLGISRLELLRLKMEEDVERAVFGFGPPIFPMWWEDEVENVNQYDVPSCYT